MQAAIEKNQVKSAHMKTMTIQAKLDAYEKHKDTIIRIGEEHYHKTINKLMKETIGHDDNDNK